MDSAWFSILFSAICFGGPAFAEGMPSSSAVYTQTSCVGQSSIKTIKVTGVVTLNKLLLGKSKESALELAAREQIKFLFRELNNQDDRIKHLSFGHKSTLKILDSQDTPYGMSYSMVKKESEETPSTDYLVSFEKLGKTHESDPGIKIHYQFESDVALCLIKDETKLPENLKVPKDPYLGNWIVPQNLHQEITWRQATATINPCADDEYADIPDPQYYWYFWNPHLERKTSNSNFSCENLIDKSFLEDLKVSFSDVTTDSQPLQLKAEASMTGRTAVIIGWNETQRDSFLDQPRLTKELTHYTDSKFAMDQKTAWVDDASKILIETLANLKSRYANSAIDFKTTKHAIIVHWKLNNNGPQETSFYWGPTDQFSKVSPEHWSFYTDALQRDDLIIYAGHSGLGRNLELPKSFHHSKRISKIKMAHQTIAILSCFALNYFEAENFVLPKNRTKNFEREAIYSAGEISHYTPMITFLIESYLSPEEHKKISDLSDYSLSDDFYVVQAIRNGTENVD